MWLTADDGSCTDAQKYELLKTASGKSINVQIVLTKGEEGKPIQMFVRVQLKKADENYGQISDPTYVTVNP